jgi:hypothetical protein
MLFWYIRFALEWTIWLIFADKKRWRELLPVGLIAGLYGATTDIITYHYPLWVSLIKTTKCKLETAEDQIRNINPCV